MRECLGGETPAKSDVGIVIAQSLGGFAVVHRIDDGQDMRMVLRRSAQHRRATNVDVVQREFHRAVRLRHGFLERIEVHRHHVDGGDFVVRHRLGVDVAPGEDAAVDYRVQRLHAPVHDLRKPGDGCDLRRRDTAFQQCAARAAGGDDLDPKVEQRMGELGDAGLVRNAQQGASRLPVRCAHSRLKA